MHDVDADAANISIAKLSTQLFRFPAAHRERACVFGTTAAVQTRGSADPELHTQSRERDGLLEAG